MKIRRDDEVLVITGDDRGKRERFAVIILARIGLWWKA